MAAKRVRQIREGSEYLVSSPKNEDIVVALREIAAGKVIVKETEEDVVEEQEESEGT
jgi:DNA-directed RNA polymerase subunit omega